MKLAIFEDKDFGFEVEFGLLPPLDEGSLLFIRVSGASQEQINRLIQRPPQWLQTIIDDCRKRRVHWVLVNDVMKCFEALHPEQLQGFITSLQQTMQRKRK